MSVTDDQARAITYLAAACRPKGAPRWDEQGIYAQVMKIADRNLPMVIEHVIRHASDAKARTPGVIAGNFTPQPVVGQPMTPTPPRREDQCRRCGGVKPACACTREQLAAVYDDDTTDTTPFRDAKAAAFAAARQARRAPIIHQPGCTWETTPHCDCGADPERTTPTEEDATEETQ